MFKSPENITINNVDLSALFDEGTDAYFVVNAVRGRDEDEYGLLQTRVPTRVGAYLLGKETGNRVVEVDFTLKGVSHIDVRNKLTHIRDLMQTSELTLVFDDDPEIYHRGTFVSLSNRDEVRTIYQGTLTFDCDPYRYFVSTKTYAFIDGLVTVNNVGTGVSEPIYTITANESITYVDVFNDDNYIRVGQPAPVDMTPVAREELMMSDAMASTVGWTTAGTSVDGGVVAGTMAANGYSFSASSYGTGPAWHGPALKRSIPGAPLTDFMVSTRFNISGTASNLRGRVEFTLLDDLSQVTAKFAMKRVGGGAGGNVAELRLGDASNGKTVLNFAGTKGNAWRNFTGIMRLTRTGQEWTIYVAIVDAETGKHHTRYYYTYSDREVSFARNLSQIQIHIGAYGTNATNPMDIRDIKIYRINQVTATEIPYIAHAGDVITVDTTQNLIAINGEERNDLKDFGGTYFDLQKGSTTLAVEPSDKVDATVTFRERNR